MIFTEWTQSPGFCPMKIELEKVGGSAAEVMCHCVTVNAMASTELQEAQARKQRPPRVSANHSLTVLWK